MTDDSDTWGFFKVPKLEARHFVNHDGVWGKLVEYFDGGIADIADKVGIVFFGVEKSFDERAGRALAFGRCNADNRARTVIEKIFGEAGFVFETQWRDGRTTKNVFIR